MGKLKSTALNGCWKKFWPEGVSDFWGFPDQQDKVKSGLMVAHRGFPHVQEADTQTVLDSLAANQ